MPKSEDLSPEIHWLSEPEEHDYPEAGSYLRLVFDEAQSFGLVEQLRRAPVVRFAAKDIFRASGLSLLGISNAHVEKDRQKIRKGLPLSPILLVRDPRVGRVVVADGYHRLCAVYGFDEDAWIQCKIV